MAEGSAATDVRQTFSAHIGPQPGPQQLFLSSPADIAIYGGAAGGGKTFAELLEPPARDQEEATRSERIEEVR